MLIFHFNKYAGYFIAFRYINTCVFRKNDIPTDRRYFTIFHILKNSLMKIPNIIVVGFISLTEYFVLYNFFPRKFIDSFIENKFYWIDDIFIKILQIIWLQFIAILLNCRFNVIKETLFSNK